MGSKKKQTVGYKYYLGVHMPFCHGPIDKITRIRVDDRVAWGGESTGGTISINEPKLFGGDGREGGISGDVDFDFGGPAQTVNTYLQSKQANNIPAYRGVAAAILKQVYLGNNPYLKPWEFRAQRIHTSTRGVAQWYDAKSEISDSANSDSFYEYKNIYESTDLFSPIPFPEDYTLEQSSLKVTNTVGNQTLSRSIPDGKIVSIETRFTLDLLSESDSSSISFPGLFFIPRFQDIPGLPESSDPNQGAWINGTPITTYALNEDEQYRLLVNFNDTTLDYFLYDGGDNLIENGSMSSAEVIADGDSIVWNSADGIVPGTIGPYEVHWYDTTITYAILSGDMNPAHIIRECLTDTSWGLGYTAADIDDTSFTAASDTLFDENFGLSFLWSKEVEIEEFIQDVLRHIDAALYVSPSTGKFVLKLIRDDYVLASLPIFDESNIVDILDYKKPTIGELKNYISVKYWDRSKSENSSISVQDPALAIQQGSISSETVQFDGITTGSLATRVAQRLAAAMGNPLITCTLITNRDAHNLNIGDAFKLTWPKYGISDVVMRVISISFGELDNGYIKIECAQDVFGLPDAVYSEPTDSNFTPITNAPSAVVDQLAREADYWTIIQDQGESFTLGNLDGYLVTAAGQPTPDSVLYRIWTDESGDYVENDPADFCPVATLTEDLPKSSGGIISTTVSISGLVADDIADIDIGSMCQVNNELMSVVSVSTSSVTVGRAVADSAIADHDSGDKIYFYGQSFLGNSDTLYQDGESINVKLTPSTGQGQLDIADATAIPLTFGQRAYRPYPPGNIKLNTVYFPDYLEGVSGVDSTWAHRDRLLQTADLNDFTESSIGPEASTTYTTTLTQVNNSVILDTNSGLTGTSDSLSSSGYDGLVRYEIKSVRSSIDSFFSQSHELPITRTSFIFTEQGDFITTEDGEYLVTES